MKGVAVIGVGQWGENHVRVFKELAAECAVEHVKIYDVDERRAKEISQSFGVECTNYEKILKDPNIQAVSIVTPSTTHYEIAKEFLEAGKDVFVEKPMTLNSEHARELIQIAKKENSILAVGHIFRYHSALCKLKDMMDRGDLGRIYTLIGNRYSMGPPRKDMGVIFALGIHEFDIFCHLLDVKYPREITAFIEKQLQPKFEETAMIAMKFEGGTYGFAMESWLTPVYGKRRELVVAGSEKSALVDYLKPHELKVFSSRIVSDEVDGQTFFSLRDEGVHTIPLEYKEPLKEELNHFIECVEDRSKPVSDGEVGLRAIEVAEAALQSAKLKKTIKMG